jgi:hypothetical protein
MRALPGEGIAARGQVNGMEKKSALELMDEAIRAMEAEGYEITTKTLRKTSICEARASWTKQAVEVRAYKYLPAEEIPPEFKALKGFSAAKGCIRKEK